MYYIRIHFIGVGHSPNYDNLQKAGWLTRTIPEFVYPNKDNITEIVAK